MENQSLRHPSHCGHCSYLPGNMNLLPNMPMMPSMAANAWGPWHMPYMNVPSMPFMSPVPNMLPDPMDMMRQNMNMFQQKASMIGMFHTPQENLDNIDKSTKQDSRKYSKRSGPVKNGFHKSHQLQDEYKQRRKSLPSEHDLIPDFYDHSQSAENFSDFNRTKQKAFESESLSTNILSKSTDEGYASYQKTYKGSQREPASSEKRISKLENYTKSPPMRRKSLPTTPNEIDNEHGNIFSSEVFIHPIHANHSVPAFQTYRHQYQENAYKKRVNKSNDLDESLYSIDTSDDDDTFDSSLEGKLFVVNCFLAPMWK